MPMFMLRPNLALRWEDWGDRWALYQGAANETHFLNDLGAETLHLLAETPLDLDALVEQLAARAGLAADARLRQQVGHLLRRFEELGLIAPVRHA